MAQGWVQQTASSVERHSNLKTSIRFPVVVTRGAHSWDLGSAIESGVRNSITDDGDIEWDFLSSETVVFDDHDGLIMDCRGL